jgi:ABC-type iron transport system FetAB ATPase subunit
MFGEEYENEVLKIPMSNDTIIQRIQDMSHGESQVIANIKEADFVAIQLNELVTSLLNHKS